jgi:hypothetical protein
LDFFDSKTSQFLGKSFAASFKSLADIAQLYSLSNTVQGLCQPKQQRKLLQNVVNVGTVADSCT